MDPKEFDALAFKYFASGLTPGELEAFRAALREHPELRRRFLEESIRVGTIHEWAAEQQAAAPRVRPVARWIVLAAAAAVVLIAGGFILIQSRSPEPAPIVITPAPKPVPPPPLPPEPEKPVTPRPLPPPIPTPLPPAEPPAVKPPPPVPPPEPSPAPVPPPEPKPAPPTEPARTEAMAAAFEHVQGAVLAGKGEPKAGAGIPAGSSVKVADGVAVLVFPDGTRAALGPDTEITDVRNAGGKQLTLVRGAVALDVTPQPRDLPLRVQTAHGTVTVVGTSFTLRADAARLRVEVDEGRVRLENPQGRSVVVGKNQFTESGPEMTVKRLPPPDLLSDLVGHWKFDETGGNVAHDASPHRHHATVEGPARVPGKSGPALKFDGVDDFVRLPRSPILDALQEGDYTAAAWAQPADVPRTGRSVLFGKVGFHIGLALEDARFTMWHYLSAGPDGGLVHARAGAAAAAGEWIHLAGVVSPSKGFTQLFVNGRLEGQTRWTLGTTARDYGARGWTIGMAREAGVTYHPFAGILDDFRLYRRALAPREIALLAGVPYAAPLRIR